MDKSTVKSFNNKSLDRALQILISFNSERKAMTLTEVARVVGLPKSTTLRLCASLVEYDFLQTDGETKQYRPGLKLFELGGLVFASFSLVEIASPYLSKFHKIVGQTVFLDILRDDQILHIDKREDPLSPIRFGLQLGVKRPPYYGAPAQVLMAYLSDDEIDRLMEKFPLAAFTKKTVTNRDTFRERLRVIRSQGYFVDEGEIVEGLSAVGAPVYDNNGRVTAAVAVACVSESMKGEAKKMIIRETVKVASAISQSMGYVAREATEISTIQSTESRIF